MSSLKEQVSAYLKANGISIKYFAKFIGCEYTNTSKWLNNGYDLNMRQIDKAYKFIAGEHLIPIEEVMQSKR